MPAIKVKCPSCESTLKLDLQGRTAVTIRCPKCAKTFRFGPPAKPPESAASEADKPAMAAPAKPSEAKASPDAPAVLPPEVPAPMNKQGENISSKKPARPRPEPEDEESDSQNWRSVTQPEAEASRRKKPAKKSSLAMLLAGGAVMLLLVCGGVMAGGFWAVSALIGTAKTAVAQMPSKAGSPDTTTPTDSQQPDLGSPKNTSENSSADAGALDLHFVAADFAIGAVVRGRALKSPVIAPLLTEEMFTAVAKDYGINLRKVNHVLLLVEMSPDTRIPPSPAAVIRFNEATDGKAFLGKLLKDGKESTAEGKSYLASQSQQWFGTAVAGHVADNRTVVIAPEPTLKKMLASKGDGPLAKQLSRLDPSADASAAFVMEPVKKIVGELLTKGKQDIPPEFAEAATLHERLKGGTLTLSLSGDTLIKVNLDATNEESGAVIEKLLTQFRALIDQNYPMARQSLGDEIRRLNDQTPGELLMQGLSVIDQVREGIQVSRVGSPVTVTIKTPKGIAALTPKVGAFIKEQMNPPSEEWKTLTRREEGYSISIPGKQLRSRSRNGSLVETGYDTFVKDRYNFAVFCNEVSEDQGPRAKDILDGYKATQGATMKDRHDVKLNGFPGVEFTLDDSIGGTRQVGILRFFIVKNRIYRLTVGRKGQVPDPALVKKFFDSFTLLDDCNPAKPLVNAGLPPTPLAKQVATGLSLKGDPRSVAELAVTPIKLPAATMLPCICWSDEKGTAFFCLEQGGLLRRVSYPDLKEEWTQDLGVKCAWLSVSAAGLLVTPADRNEVWLLDSVKGEMKQRFSVEGLQRAVGSLASSWGVASNGGELYALDLKSGTASRYTGARPPLGGYSAPILSPDGKALFTNGMKANRFSTADGQLRFEESAANWFDQNVESGMTISPDSKEICIPCYLGELGFAVFAVGSLQQPLYPLGPNAVDGGRAYLGRAATIDPKGGYAYAGNLRLFDAKGEDIKSYPVARESPQGTGVRQLLVHTAGKRLLVMSMADLAAIEVPGALKPDPSAGTPKGEDPEFFAYAKKKSWHVVNEGQGQDGKPIKSMLVGDVTTDDCKMIAKAKAIQILYVSRVSDEGLKLISGMPQLERITVGGDDVTDAGIKALAQCMSLQSVSLRTSKVTDAGVKELAALPKLHRLTLEYMTLTGSAFAAFNGSKNLETLILQTVDGFTDDGARNVAKIPNLNDLEIGTGYQEKKLTTAGIKAIAAIRVPAKFTFDTKLMDDELLETLVAKGWLYGPTPPSLSEKKPATPGDVQFISLGECKVTDKGLNSVLNCTNITSLHLSRTGVTDETLKKLSGFKKLNSLSVDYTKVTAVGLDAVSGLPLRTVSLRGCQLSEDSFKAFGKMTALERLDLSEAKMKGEWLKHIAAQPNLKNLELTKADFDDAVVKYVTTMPKLEYLTLNDTRLGDKGFQELVALPNLKSLYVDGTKVTKEVYQNAKKAHPKLKLFHDQKSTCKTPKVAVIIRTDQSVSKCALSFNCPTAFKGGTGADQIGLAVGKNPLRRRPSLCIPSLSRDADGGHLDRRRGRQRHALPLLQGQGRTVRSLAVPSSPTTRSAYFRGVGIRAQDAGQARGHRRCDHPLL